MASIAGACSSNVLFRSREVGSNGVFLGHYNGLRPVENMQMASAAIKPNGFNSTSGLSLLVFHFSCFVKHITWLVIEELKIQEPNIWSRVYIWSIWLFLYLCVVYLCMGFFWLRCFSLSHQFVIVLHEEWKIPGPNLWRVNWSKLIYSLCPIMHDLYDFLFACCVALHWFFWL